MSLFLSRVYASKNLPKLLGGLVFVIGLMTIAGWYFDIIAFKSITDKIVAMNPVTALCFMLLGLSVFNFPSANSLKKRRLLTVLFSLIPVIIGTLTIIGYLTGIDFNIERIFFAEKLFGNRIAPNTAINFVLAGLSILLLIRPGKLNIIFSQIFSFLTGLTSFLAIIGYIYGVNTLYKYQDYIPMALNTSIAFIILMMGALALKSNHGFISIISSEFFGGLTARRLIPIAVVLPVLYGFLRLKAEENGIIINPASGVALLSITIIFTFFVFVVINAQIINRTDKMRHEAELELQKALQDIRNLYDYAPCGYHSVNKNGIIIEANETLLKWLGYSRDEFIGKKRIGDLYSSISSEKLQQVFLDYQNKGFANDVEMELRKKDGTTFPVMMNSTAIKDNDGNFIQSNTNTFDITRRKKAEKKFITLLDSAPDSMVIVNGKGEIQLVNRQTEKLFGYDREELIGQKVEMLMPDEFRLKHAGHRETYINNLSVRPMGIGLELFGLRKDGTRFPVEISLSPLDTGEDTLVSAAIRDITERKKAEKVLTDLNRRLEESNKELEAFSYSVSHDLRAPLRHITGFSEKLERISSDLDNEQIRLLGKISDSAEKMGLLIDDLLMFSRTGRTELIKIDIDTERLIHEIVEQQKLSLSNNNVHIKVEKLPFIKADKIHIKLVFENLISNAIKYSSKKHNAEITIGCENNDSNEHIFYIKDNGSGFDMNYVDKLFVVFQRLHADEQYEGTGIGLATVRRIVNRHGGRAWAKGKINEGATFYFSLPKY